MARSIFKFYPNDTKIKYSTSWATWRKSTRGRLKETHRWDQRDAQEYNRMRAFTQPPRTHQDGTVYFCTPLKLDEHQMATMNAQKREHNYTGLFNVGEKDAAITKCLTDVKMPLTGRFSAGMVMRFVVGLACAGAASANGAAEGAAI
eukprot:69087-Pyramimonas_sp.AAC.1